MKPPGARLLALALLCLSLQGCVAALVDDATNPGRTVEPRRQVQRVGVGR